MRAPGGGGLKDGVGALLRSAVEAAEGVATAWPRLIILPASLVALLGFHRVYGLAVCIALRRIKRQFLAVVERSSLVIHGPPLRVLFQEAGE